jgi:hypothetical protein
MVSDNYKAFQNEGISKIVEPAMAHGETQIKLLIRNYLVNQWGETEMFRNIDRVIARVMNELPAETPNKDAIFKAFKISSQSWYNIVRNQIRPIVVKLGILNKSPVDGKWIQRAYKKIESTKLIPIEPPTNVTPNYMGVMALELARLNTIIKEMARFGLTTEYIPQQTPISVFAQLEMAIRYRRNVEQAREKLEDSELIVRFSQHFDCSERCSMWQGKLVHLLAPSKNVIPSVMTTQEIKTLAKSNNKDYIEQFETDITLNGETVYSYKAITSVKDEYGWNNNIHTGFNCRHYLKSANDVKKDPIPGDQIREARKSNAKLRNMERRIRNLKKDYALLIDDRERMKASNYITQAVKEYYSFAKENRVIAYGWRLEI